MSLPATAIEAPRLETGRWFNVEAPLTLEALRGRVVAIVAFQMLCPGCVARSIPLAKRLEQAFSRDELVVLGLHTVFEYHDAMSPDALAAFLAEYRVRFPVAVDRPDPDGSAVPLTMQAYRMQGTPTRLLIDAEGRLRSMRFGAHDELETGVEIGRLAERAVAHPAPNPGAMRLGDVHCDEDGCSLAR